MTSSTVSSTRIVWRSRLGERFERRLDFVCFFFLKGRVLAYFTPLRALWFFAYFSGGWPDGFIFKCFAPRAEVDGHRLVFAVFGSRRSQKRPRFGLLGFSRRLTAFCPARVLFPFGGHFHFLLSSDIACAPCEFTCVVHCSMHITHALKHNFTTLKRHSKRHRTRIFQVSTSSQVRLPNRFAHILASSLPRPTVKVSSPPGAGRLIFRQTMATFGEDRSASSNCGAWSTDPPDAICGSGPQGSSLQDCKDRSQAAVQTNFGRGNCGYDARSVLAFDSARKRGLKIDQHCLPVLGHTHSRRDIEMREILSRHNADPGQHPISGRTAVQDYVN